MDTDSQDYVHWGVAHQRLCLNWWAVSTGCLTSGMTFAFTSSCLKDNCLPLFPLRRPWPGLLLFLLKRDPVVPYVLGQGVTLPLLVWLGPPETGDHLSCYLCRNWLGLPQVLTSPIVTAPKTKRAMLFRCKTSCFIAVLENSNCSSGDDYKISFLNLVKWTAWLSEML